MFARGRPRRMDPGGAALEAGVTGGVRTPSDALVGPVAGQAIRSLDFDLVFVGCHGISTAAGLTAPNLAEAQANRACCARPGGSWCWPTAASAAWPGWPALGARRAARWTRGSPARAGCRRRGTRQPGTCAG